MKKVVVICGPTAVGKSQLGLALAQYYQTSIINGDAYQIYQKMNIGTAKPTKEQLSTVKHEMCDFLDPLQPFSIYDYQKQVRKLIDSKLASGQLPLIVGGTGLYIDSVIYDYRFEDTKRDLQFEKRYESLTNEQLFELLQSKNLVMSQSIDKHNRRRILRALAFDEQFQQNRLLKNQKYYLPLIIFLEDDREALYERINKRVDEMLSKGLLKEVESLYPDHIGAQASKAIGYKELIAYLNNESTLEEAIAKIKQNTRRYAKRQWTWYRKHPDVVFIRSNEKQFNQTIDEAIKLIDHFLKN